jgi:hypothetical protein
VNFAQMQAEVQNGNRAADSTLIPVWLQDIYERWCAAHRWAALEVTQTATLTSGVASYLIAKTGADGASGPAIAPEFGSMIAFRCSASAIMKPLKLAQVDQQVWSQLVGHSAGIATGPPAFYTLRGGAPASSSGPAPGTPYSDLTKVAGDIMTTIELYPTPNYAAVTETRYFRQVSSLVLTNSNDVPILPVSTHLGMCLEAIAYSMMKEGQVTPANQMYAQADRMMKMAIEEDLRRRRGDNEMVGVLELPELRQPTAAQANPQDSPYPALSIEGN